MINESGTMSGGGGKPRGGRMCLGKAALASIDTQTAAAELQAAEQELEAGAEVLILALPALIQVFCWQLLFLLLAFGMGSTIPSCSCFNLAHMCFTQAQSWRLHSLQVSST